MTRQHCAVLLIFMLAGHEVYGIRQVSEQKIESTKAADLVDILRETAFTELGSESAASCDTDIIVESSRGDKKVVLAASYEKEPVEILTKYATAKPAATYTIECAGGKAAVVKTLSSGQRTVRPFNAFHWWRDTQIKKDETSITFSKVLGWETMTAASGGKVKFTPSGKSCEESKSEIDTLGEQVVSMIKQNRLRNFRRVSHVLKEYSKKQHEMKAMGCPADMLGVDESVTNTMKEYWTANQGGKDSPMADARFAAALDKIKSISNPTKEDFAEVVALMKYGACPESKETRVSKSRARSLPDEVDESQEEALQADVESCFAEENCQALEAKFPADSALLQESESSGADQAMVASENYPYRYRSDGGFLVGFLVFITVLILCIVFWPIAWIIILVWLLMMLLWLPFALLGGPTVVYQRVTYQLGAFDYLVDEFCRPAIHSSGLPIRKTENGNVPSEMASPVKRYVIYGGKPLYDDRVGWPIAMLDDGTVKPLVGLPKPAASLD